MSDYPAYPLYPDPIPGQLYPQNWVMIADALRGWALWRCEVCGADHNPFTGYCLTVHHLDMNPGNNDWRNLLVCCQRCHLRTQAEYRPGQSWLFDKPTWAIIRGL